MLRKPASNITRQVLTWDPQGKQKRGRPRNTRRCDLQADMQRLGRKWQQLEKVTQNRELWRTLVDGLSPLREQWALEENTQIEPKSMDRKMVLTNMPRKSYIILV